MLIVIKLPVEYKVTDHTIYFIQSGMPNCVGAIDDCQTSIPQPENNGEDYWNQQFSINLQNMAVCSGS